MSDTAAADRAAAREEGSRVIDRPWVVAGVLGVALAIPLLAGALVAAAGPGVVFWLGFGVAGVALVGTLLRYGAAPVVLATLFIGWLALHKVVVAAVAPSIVPGHVSWLLNFKELLYVGLLAVPLAAAALPVVRDGGVPDAARRALAATTLADRLAIAFVGLVAVSFVVGALLEPGNVRGQLVYARRFASLPIVFLAGRLLLPRLEHLSRTVRYVIVLAAGVAAFGLVERVLLGDRFWTELLNVRDYVQALISGGVASPRTKFIADMPANWWTEVAGIDIRRLVSTFLEPTTLAMFLGFAGGLAAFVARPEQGRAWRWWLTLGLIGAALVLTFGKAGAMLAAIVAAFAVLRATRSSVPRLALALLVIGIAGLAAAWIFDLFGNVLLHVRGLVTGLTTMAVSQPLGAGLGQTGYWGVQVGIGNDSTIGAVASQLGVPGLLLHVAWMAAVVALLLPAAGDDRPDVPLRRVLAGTVAALLMIGVVSNSTTGLLAAAPPILLAGWAASIVGSRTDPRPRA